MSSAYVTYLAELDASDRVAHRVEPGRVERESHHVGDDDDYDPGDARLGRHATLQVHSHTSL